MPASLVTPTEHVLTGGGSAGTYDDVTSPIYTAGLVLKNRSTANVFFVGNADPTTAFATIQPGTQVTIGGDGTPRRARFFLGGTALDVLEFITLDNRDN